MNKVLKYALSLGKFLFAIFLIYLVFSAAFVPADGIWQKIIAIAILLAVLIPTVFIFYAKDHFMQNPRFAAAFKKIKILYIILLILFFLILIFGFYVRHEVSKSEQAVEKIKNTKITLADAMGENLPPAPNPEINNSTVEGIDENNNKIRDDVELAIFERYPDSARIRAAMLQYAQALQLQLTEVYNSETLVATIQGKSRAGLCIGEVEPKLNLDDSTEKMNEVLAIDNERRQYVDNVTINTDNRKGKLEKIFDYLVTHSLPDQENCDVSASLLPN